MPLTASTIRPAQSIEMLYSQRSPGSASNGVPSTSREAGFGTPLVWT